MTARIILILGIALSALTCASALQWSNCPNETSDLQTLKDVKLEPEPVPVGATAKFTIEGQSSKTGMFLWNLDA